VTTNYFQRVNRDYKLIPTVNCDNKLFPTSHLSDMCWQVLPASIAKSWVKPQPSLVTSHFLLWKNWTAPCCTHCLVILVIGVVRANTACAGTPPLPAITLWRKTSCGPTQLNYMTAHLFEVCCIWMVQIISGFCIPRNASTGGPQQRSYIKCSPLQSPYDAGILTFLLANFL
jgi:hypothetical protein